MYNPALAPASQRTQIHWGHTQIHSKDTNVTESGQQNKQQHLELGLSAQ